MDKILGQLMLLVFAGFCLMNAGAPAHAANASETEIVKELSYEEKVKIWNGLSEEQKNSLRQRARGMTEKKFSELKNNFEKIKNFEPQEQKRIRKNFQRMRQFKPQQKQDIRQKFKRFRELPPERKRVFREKYRENGKDSMEKNRPGKGRINNSKQHHGPNRMKPEPGSRPDLQKMNQNRMKPEPGSRPNLQKMNQNRKPGSRLNRPPQKNEISPQQRKQRFEEIKNFREKMLNSEQSGSQPKPQRWQKIKEFRNRFNNESELNIKPDMQRPKNFQRQNRPGEKLQPGQFRRPGGVGEKKPMHQQRQNNPKKPRN